MEDISFDTLEESEKQAINARLREGIASGFSEMTAENWQRLKDRIAQRRAEMDRASNSEG